MGVATGDLPRLEGWVEQALYGMAGEAISNAIRHGGAKHISISLREWRRRAIIVIVDDGRGFEPATVARRRGDEGLGLLGMTRQARWLGGRMDLTSRPGSGPGFASRSRSSGIESASPSRPATTPLRRRPKHGRRTRGGPGAATRGRRAVDADTGTRWPRGRLEGPDDATEPSAARRDHEMARRGLTAMLSTADWITVVGEADGCASGLAAIERLRPDIVLLDIRMPGQDGLACLEEIKQLGASGRRGDGHPVRRSPYVLEAIRRGAAGYLLKDASTREVIVDARERRRGPARGRAAAAPRGTADPARGGAGGCVPRSEPRRSGDPARARRAAARRGGPDEQGDRRRASRSPRTRSRSTSRTSSGSCARGPHTGGDPGVSDGAARRRRLSAGLGGLVGRDELT